ncbi:type II toxin-antitoxin system HicA family toxin [Spirulina sp. CCNP1310]|uniref:type II toxin-antitoxin system HicA family toxin n=1 Tax=Spirulina sp. CCNP1310 TaxID=3110249 RepID=UPI003A4C576E
MKVKDIIKILENDGWYHVRTKGSHWQFRQLMPSLRHVGGKETGFQGCCSGEGVGARNPVSSLRFETGFLGGFGREMRGWGQPGFWI